MSDKHKTSRRVVEEAFAAHEVVNCHYCGRRVWRWGEASTSPKRAIGEHRVPISRGGRDIVKNIVIACRACDVAKGPLTEQEFLSLRNDPEALDAARIKWLQRLNDQPPVGRLYREPGEKRAAKRARRAERLAERIQLPDPDCGICEGTGISRIGRNGKRGRAHDCPCRFLQGATGGWA